MSIVHRTGNLSPEFALLGFLVGRSSHGYDLHQRCIKELGHVWHLSQSQAYAILKRLEVRGEITTIKIKQSKLPGRLVLKITSIGRRRFMIWLKNGCGRNARAIRLEFLTRLYFSNLYTPDNTQRIYATQSEEIKNSIQHLENLLAQLPPEQTYNRLSLDLRLRQMKLIQEWMVETKTQFHISTEDAP